MPRNLKRKTTRTPRTTARIRTLEFGHGKADLLKVQISVQVKTPKGFRLTARVLREAVAAKLGNKSFKDPRGFKIKIVWWQNPSRPVGRLTDTYYSSAESVRAKGKRSYGSQFERWSTLRGALQHTSMDFKPVGKGK